MSCRPWSAGFSRGWSAGAAPLKWGTIISTYEADLDVHSITPPPMHIHIYKKLMIGTIMENPTADSAAGRSQSQKRKTEKPQMLRLCGNISRIYEPYIRSGRQ